MSRNTLDCGCHSTTPRDREWEGLESRIGEIERNLNRFRPVRAEVPNSDRRRERDRQNVSDQWVTHSDLKNAVEDLRVSFSRDTDRRFQANEQAMEALRELILQTDSMLERVLENLESART
jgi:hypothetical protein